MKPFNRELAAQGAKLVTRDGRKVIHYHDTKLDVLYPIVAFIDGEDNVKMLTKYGKYVSQIDHHLDLFMDTGEEFVVVFEDGEDKFAVVGDQKLIKTWEGKGYKIIKQFPL